MKLIQITGSISKTENPKITSRVNILGKQTCNIRIQRGFDLLKEIKHSEVQEDVLTLMYLDQIQVFSGNSMSFIP